MLAFTIQFCGNVCHRTINPSKSPASDASINGDAEVRNLDSAQSRVHVNLFVSTSRAVEVPVFFCLRRSCKHVTEVGGP
jgi:hypothetical protein